MRSIFTHNIFEKDDVCFILIWVSLWDVRYMCCCLEVLYNTLTKLIVLKNKITIIYIEEENRTVFF